MPELVCMGAQLKCSFGVAPAVLIVPPRHRAIAGVVPAATIMDHKPIVNIPTFGMCQSIANPVVASATSAALGVLTPMPCVPATSTPWAPGSPTVLIGNEPALHKGCKCMCTWGGVIEVLNPGQMQTTVG